MFYYVNNFLFFSIFGFFFETLLFKIIDLHSRSGFMYLWWTPFYGLGVVFSILIYKYLSKIIKDKLKFNVVLAMALFITVTVTEFVGGYMLELTHGYSLWSYENMPLHMGKYVSVPTSLAWTLFAFFYLYVIKKYSDKLMNIIPKCITYVLSLVFICDFILTTVKLIYNHL